MSEFHAKGVTVTFTPVHKGKFLFVQRQSTDDTLPGYWCFPGGKVHIGETIAGALVRELKEETSLDPTGRAFFVNSYTLGDRVGAHFAVEVTDNDVSLQELQAHAWVKTVNDLAAFSPRVTGVDNHLVFINRRLKLIRDLSRLAPVHAAAFENLGWQSLTEFNYVTNPTL